MELITLCPNLVELFMWAKVMFAGNKHEHYFSKKKTRADEHHCLCPWVKCCYYVQHNVFSGF